MAISTAQYGRIMEPGVRKLFFDTLKEYPEEYSKVFRVQTSDKAIETDVRLGGFGMWDSKDSMGSVKYQDLPGELSLQYIHEEFASGFTVERKFIDDEQYNIVSKLTQKLARSARATIETKAAWVLNHAFDTSVKGYDGQPLVSSSHPRLDKGTAVVNQASGKLTDANLKTALILAAEQVDDAGILVQMQPKVLVVPPQLEYTAKTIIGGSNLSPNGDGTLASGVSNAATDKNVLQNGLRIVVMHYLQALDKTTNQPATSSTSQANTVYPWFLVDPTIAELNFFWRKRLEFKNTTDFDTDQQKYRGYMRFSAGYSDFRGLIASPGY